MSGKHRNSDAERARALDLWEAPAGAGEPLICLATTFTFDAAFFETECLGRFLQMDSHPQESEQVGYLIEREEKLASARVSVFVDRRHATSKESMRWDVLPISVPGGIQHSKLAVLCWANHVRLIVGSGNLTEPGYRKNLEVFGAIDISKKDGGMVSILLASLGFLKALLGRAAGEEGRGPRQRAEEMMESIRAHVARWPRPDSEGRVVSVFTGLGRSLFDQVQDMWPSTSPPRQVEILSPFYDSSAHWSEVIEGLGMAMAKRGERNINFLVPCEKLPDGRTRIGMPREIVDAASKRAQVSVAEVLAEQDKEIRPLHAKMLVFTSEQWRLTLVGSSNFTRAGLGVVTAKRLPVNFEANLVYLVRKGDPELNSLRGVRPSIAEDGIDLGSKKLIWEPIDEVNGEDASAVPLPIGFQEALFSPGRTPRLVIVLQTTLPKWWEIRDAENNTLISSEMLDHASGTHEIAWASRAIPFVLIVTWRGKGKEEIHAASWPVNVLDPAALPPPDILGSLTLEELLQMLGSTRPLHIAVVQALQRRSRKNKGKDGSLNPLDRVNTETFLLRRTKRVALALERLRDRLEKPVLTREAFDWRLRGPVGPLALANAFLNEGLNSSEKAFFLAELALTLKRVHVARAAEGGLKTDVIRSNLDACLASIKALLPDQKGEATPVGRYVKRAFAEASN